MCLCDTQIQTQPACRGLLFGPPCRGADYSGTDPRAKL